MVEHPPSVADACSALDRGKLVIIPTETVYGLAADARNDEAIRTVFDLKGRPLTKPLIVHVASATSLDDWAEDIPDYAYALAQAYWPGPLTLVLKKKETVSPLITGGQDTVALRVPKHPLAQQLLDQWGGAVVAPSANRYGQLSPTTAEAARDAFGSEAPMIVDGGPCEVGIESTMVLCIGSEPVLLRPGLINREDIEQVAGRSLLSEENLEIEAPGRAPSHYAPRTPCVVWDRKGHPQWRPETTQIGFIGFSAPPFEVARFVAMPPEPKAAAHMLYQSLHALDQAGFDHLVVESVPQSPPWSAIADRLARASLPSECSRG